MSRVTPLGALFGGMLAGLVGTAAMDLVWYLRYRRGGGESNPLVWEFSAGMTWESAAAPAQVGKRAIEGMFQTELPESAAPLVNNVVHWGYGVAWGGLFGLVAGSLRRPRVWHGLLLGPIVWSSGYAMLAPMKLYKPMWEYDLPTLWKDLSAHLAYGTATAAIFRLLAGR